MAVFNPNEVSDQQLDWTILRDGGVALYWRPEVLAEDIEHLRLRGYRTIEFDASRPRADLFFPSPRRLRAPIARFPNAKSYSCVQTSHAGTSVPRSPHPCSASLGETVPSIQAAGNDSSRRINSACRRVPVFRNTSRR